MDLLTPFSRLRYRVEWYGVSCLIQWKKRFPTWLQQWPRVVRLGFSTARLTELRIPPGNWCLSLVSVVCCEVVADYPSRGFLPSVACLSMIVKPVCILSNTAQMFWIWILFILHLQGSNTKALAMKEVLLN
jgi:hypothetical protein